MTIRKKQLNTHLAKRFRQGDTLGWGARLFDHLFVQAFQTYQGVFEDRIMQERRRATKNS